MPIEDVHEVLIPVFSYEDNSIAIPDPNIFDLNLADTTLLFKMKAEINTFHDSMNKIYNSSFETQYMLKEDTRSLVEIFGQAANYLEQFGWIIGKLYNTYGSACLEGSLYLDDSNLKTSNTFAIVRDMLKYTMYTEYGYHTSLPLLNDRKIKCQQEAIDFLRKCEKNAMLLEDGIITTDQYKKALGTSQFTSIF